MAYTHSRREIATVQQERQQLLEPHSEGEPQR